MEDEGFLKRWSRRKLESRQAGEPPPEPPPEQPPEPLPDAPPEQTVDLAPCADAGVPTSAPAQADAEAARLLTMDDVATLTPESDFSGFVARGVEQAVRRSALKKLFADPHFNTMDGLDIYIDDYNKPSPLSDTMLASLRHAARLFERVADAAADADTDAEPQEPQEPQDRQHPPETETR